MKNTTASKRNPVFPLLFFFILGLGLLLTQPRFESNAKSASRPALQKTLSAPQVMRFAAEDMYRAASESLSAPETHAYGFELLNQGRWAEAEPVLKSGCETGDLSSCTFLAQEYMKRGRSVEAQDVFLVSCRGGHLNGCRQLLDHDSFTESARTSAIDRLSVECREGDSGSACLLLAESRWARADIRRSRAFMGMACSRGMEETCAKL